MSLSASLPSPFVFVSRIRLRSSAVGTRKAGTFGSDSDSNAFAFSSLLGTRRLSATARLTASSGLLLAL